MTFLSFDISFYLKMNVFPHTDDGDELHDDVEFILYFSSFFLFSYSF